MKKTILSIAVLLLVGLSGCGNKQNAEKIAEQETKIEELEKKISTIEETSVLSSEEIDNILIDIKSDINKKITEAFLDAGLMMYGNKGDGPEENPAVDVNNVDNIPPRLIGMSFYTEPQSGLIITIENFANQEDMDDTIKFHINNELFDYEIEPNEYINSIMYFSKRAESLELDQSTFEKYLEVFESIR